MPNQEAWETRWRTADTPWDLGGATPALVHWLKEQTVRDQAILTPGCGRGHDAHILAKAGADVVAVDISPAALDVARAAYPQSRVSWQLGDVTDLQHRDVFDRVWEYTCFCALDPSLREAYIAQVAKALRPGGIYWGLVFWHAPGDPDSPPFGIEPTDFERLLGVYFNDVRLEQGTARSARDRSGKEIWFEAR